MRFTARFSLLLSLAVLGSACAPKTPPPVVIPPKPPIVVAPDNAQEKLAFAFIAYAGEGLKGRDRTVERTLVPCIQYELDRQPLTHGSWELVWGPMVYKFALAGLDDNMMFVARNREDRDHLVVAVRGTNTEILDWVLEDLDVFHTEPWAWGSPPAGSDPRISRATHRGLQILRRHKPRVGPGAGLTIRKFLARAVAQAAPDKVRIEIAGHSLAGALAPTLALWLDDTREAWDPRSKAELSVYAYAGATAGNGDFAAYSNSRIGDATYRYHNPYDVVPHAWELSTLRKLPDLYGDVAKMPADVHKILDDLLHKLRDSDYTQILMDEPLRGAVMTSETRYFEQASWQHHCGYLCGLEMNEVFYQVSHQCDYPPGLSTLRCPVCPQGQPTEPN